MNHEDIHQLLSAFIDNELTDSEKELITEHLQGCPDCRRRVAQLTTLKRAIHAAGDVELPYSFANMLAHSIHHKDEVTTSWLGIEHFAQRFVFGLAVLVLVLIGLTNYEQREEPLAAEHYSIALMNDSSASQILTKRGTITKEDVLMAVLVK